MKTLRTVVVVAVLLVAGIAAWHAFSPSSRQPRLVLLYAPCTVRQDFLSPYNSGVSYTPSLQAFADGAVVFDKHFTESGQSGIAFAALFTGTQAMGHGIYYHPNKLSDALYTMAEAYRDAGYETFFWAGHPMASPELNYGQGVDTANTFWKEGKNLSARQRSFLRANDPRFRQILQRLREDSRYKAFVMTNFTVSHGPYVESDLKEFCAAYPNECVTWPEPEQERISQLFRRNPLGWVYAFDQTVAGLELSEKDVEKVVQLAEMSYKSNLFYLDQLFGALISEIRANDLLDDSLIVFTSDHGEVLYRKNARLKWTHGFMLAPEVGRIPLIIRDGSVPSGHYESVTSSIDVFPTVAGLSGIDLAAERIMGENLSASVRGTEPAPQRLAFSHTSLLPDSLMHTMFRSIYAPFPTRDPNVMWVSATDGNLVYKLTSDDGSQFKASAFRLEADPATAEDVYDPTNRAHQEMIRRLSRYKTELVEAYGRKEAAPGRVPSERERELMRSLGYIE